MTTTLNQRVEAAQAEILAELRDMIILAASDESQVDEYEVASLLNQSGKDSQWFGDEVTRCRNRIAAQQALTEIARHEQESEGLSKARHDASEALRAMVIRHKAELEAARKSLRLADSNETAASSRCQRLRREALTLLNSTVGQAHREQLVSARNRIEHLQSRLHQLEITPGPSDVQFLRNSLARLESARVDPDQAEAHSAELAEIRRRLSIRDEEEQRHVTRLVELRSEITEAQKAEEKLKQLSLDPIGAF